MIYLLDTTTVSDLIDNHTQVISTFEEKRRQDNQVILCPPVRFEVERGLLWQNLQKKYRIFRDSVVPHLGWVGFIQEDWIQATQFWIQAKSKGRQLSDMDIMIAAVAHRLDAIIVSSDADFDALPINRENWR